MVETNSVVCICETHEEVQRALYNLQAASVDLETLSTITRDDVSFEHDLDYYNAGDQTFAIPGIGVLLVNGPIASWIVAAHEGQMGSGETGTIGALLHRLGVPNHDIIRYEAALRAYSFLLVLHGSSEFVLGAVRHIGGTTHCFHTVHGENVFETDRGVLLPVHQA